MMERARGTAVVLLLALAVCSVAARVAPAQGARPARFEPSRCLFQLASGMIQGRTVRCGYLIVPEDRSRPDGRSIRLAVAIFRSTAPARKSDPVVFLQGGPGGAIVSELGSYLSRSIAPSWIGDRDLILLDQRGDGLSQPSLACGELTDLKYQYLDANISNDRQIALQAEAARRCRDRLIRAGNDLTAYSSIADAADVADVGPALGYREVNLYGVSYGTRVALTVMRLFPSGIRSVVLDSVIPPRINTYLDVATSGLRAFNTLFDGCARDRACNAAFPRLGDVFYRLIARLNAHPIRFSSQANGVGKRYTVLLNGDGLADVLFQALYVTELIPVLPGMIYQIDHGSIGLLAAVYGVIGFDDSLNLGVYYSVQCGEDAPSVTPSGAVAAVGALPAMLRPSQLTVILSDLAVCRVWHARRAPPAQHDPVSSAIPTLLLAGEYDPITPPANARAAARTLRRGYVFVFPGMGHGVFPSGQCARAMTRRFLDAPTTKPSAGCLASMGAPRFITP